MATILFLDPVPKIGVRTPAFAGVTRYAAAMGWNVEIVHRPPLRQKEVAALLAAHRSVAGCVIECADDCAASSSRLFGGVPVVCLHAVKPLVGALRLSTDNEAVALAAFRELSAGRPSAFAVVGDFYDRHWSRSRVRAFRSACRRDGRQCFEFIRREEAAAQRRERLCAFLRQLPRKCAIFAVNDFVARDVADAARSIMRPIPQDLSLLGVDNRVEVCEVASPPISSIQLDFERAGYLAAKMIGDVLAKREVENVKDISAAAPRVAREGGTIAIQPLLAVRRKSTSGRGRHEKFVLEAVAMIRREACDGLTAHALAARFPVSRNLFDLRFREAVGHSALDEILHVRLENACTLLARTDTAIGAVPGLCGFKCDRTCDALFRSRFKMSMRDWRRHNAHL